MEKDRREKGVFLCVQVEQASAQLAFVETTP